MAASENPSLNASPKEITVYSHSKLFYFWPIWLFGFVFALWTYIDGTHMALVPPKSQVQKRDPAGYNIVVEKDTPLLQHLTEVPAGKEPFPIHMASSKSLGFVFVMMLMLVILVTNVPFRGLWSVVILITIILLTVILALANVWDNIFEYLLKLHIHINMAGYLFIAIGTLSLWCFAFFFFDRQVYIVFEPGQMKVCEEIGGGVTTHDTMSMTIDRKRDDLFRHWILGLGSGDLIIRPSGPNAREFHLENVLNVSTRLKEIQDMIREKTVRND